MSFKLREKKNQTKSCLVCVPHLNSVLCCHSLHRAWRTTASLCAAATTSLGKQVAGEAAALLTDKIIAAKRAQRVTCHYYFCDYIFIFLHVLHLKRI